MSVIGDNIRVLRKREGLTQQEFADICSVTRETVYKWETGTIGDVRASNVEFICDYFGVTIDDLQSEVLGLAAQDAGIAQFPGKSMVPIVSGSREVTGYTEVPRSVLERHPHAFAYAVSDDSMSRVLPESALAIIDPDMQLDEGAIVMADDPAGGPSPVMRRLHAGETGSVLSTDSYLRHEESFVVDLRGYHISGTMVWYQPQDELS